VGRVGLQDLPVQGLSLTVLSGLVKLPGLDQCLRDCVYVSVPPSRT
jgi:hypothetical protein